LVELVKPRAFVPTFNWVSQALPLNQSVRLLEPDEQAILDINRVLREMGQTQFITLARKSTDAMISVPLYAGNGIVIKIIPKGYSSLSHTDFFKLPPISVDSVEGKREEFLIKTYPWLSPRGVTQRNVEDMRTMLTAVGLKFNEQDDQPRNIHRLPDKNGTLTSIDEDIYHGDISHPELSEAWVDYVHSVFPIYQQRRVPPQNDQTDFSFVSIHDRRAEQYTFQPRTRVLDHLLELTR
jgi:hypothetical protein